MYTFLMFMFLIFAYCSILKCDSLKQYPIYYLDNGGHQTMGYRTQSIEEKITLESTVLAMLNLPKRPKFIKNPMKKSASRYLLDIYKIISQDYATHDMQKRSVDSSFFTDLDIDELQKSDKIMAFSVRSVRSLKSLRGKVFWIDVKKLKGADQLLRAELRIFKSTEGDFNSTDNDFTLHAFKITTDNKERIRHINSIHVDRAFVGWLALDITICMQQWISNSISNRGIYLTATRKETMIEVDLQEIGILYNDTEELRPFAAAFLQSHNQIIIRATRGLTLSSPNSFSHVLSSTPHRVDDRCRRYSMTINFKDLNWQDWVVAPSGYTAHYCNGECNFPLMGHINATNHAIMQSLVNIIDPYRFPKPCCAPTQFNNMSLLYFLDEENVTLKKYTDLLVASCGCH